MIRQWRRGKRTTPPPPPTLIVEFKDRMGNQLWVYESQRPLYSGDTFTLTLDDCVTGKDDDGPFIKIRVDLRD